MPREQHPSMQDHGARWGSGSSATHDNRHWFRIKANRLFGHAEFFWEDTELNQPVAVIEALERSR